MIISASRRTDIPAFYSTWFINRIRAGWCLVPNPLNYNQLAYVSLKPEDVDAIVFWSKNPEPIIPHLGELDSMGFRYYFHFTLNAYQKVLEPGIPKIAERIRIFKELSGRLGGARVVWRYDPIIISNSTPPDYHIEAFSNIATSLEGFTSRVMISFVDYYNKTQRQLGELEENGFEFDKEFVNSQAAWQLVERLRVIAESKGIEVFTCAEERDFTGVGAPPGRCIDGELMHKLWTLTGHLKKDPTQRAACLCAVSKDIGINDTCIHGCPYCYSTRNMKIARSRYLLHNPESPVLWGKTRELSESEKAKLLGQRLL